MKLVGVVGEPATGKTSIMRRVIELLGPDYKLFQFGLLRGRHYFRRNLYLLGIYRDGELFAGTDRLSMAVQPYARSFLERVPSATVLFEGDRLTRAEFLAATATLELLVIDCSDAEKARRHKARNDTQPESFHRSRRTLIKNVTDKFPHTRFVNEKPGDVQRNADAILRHLPVESP